MSVVAIPFKEEDPAMVVSNLRIAASHPRVERVWAVGSQEEIGERLAALPAGTPIQLVEERRIGHFRQGKGDAMNTALALADAERVDRLHFYDADITNFGTDWIDGAEDAADAGYQVVRHTFPRAATDAMITWFVTRPLLAMRFPGTILPRVGQPLGGEVLLTRAAISSLAADPLVTGRSDWGIDTVLTYASVAGGFPMYEHHVRAGKRHSLYGSLEDLRDMAVECFDAARSLPVREIPETRHRRDPDSTAPPSLKEEVGYSVEKTAHVLTDAIGGSEGSAIDRLPVDLARGIRKMASSGDTGFLDEEEWGRFLLAMLPMFRLGDPGAEALLFRAWAGRVVEYTRSQVPSGYDGAMAYLERTIAAYETAALNPRL